MESSTMTLPADFDALAPDGSHLAVADQSQHSILFYRIPGGGSGSTDASTSPATQQ